MVLSNTPMGMLTAGSVCRSSLLSATYRSLWEPEEIIDL